MEMPKYFGKLSDKLWKTSNLLRISCFYRQYSLETPKVQILVNTSFTRIYHNKIVLKLVPITIYRGHVTQLHVISHAILKWSLMCHV